MRNEDRTPTRPASRRRGRTVPLAAAFSVATLGAFATAGSSVGADEPPATLVGLVGDDVLVQFDEDAPEVITSSTPITGLQGGESIMSIDGRPGTGQIVALAVTDAPGAATARLYVVDPDTGVAMPAGEATIPDVDEGARTNVDFNPTVDRLRVIGSDDQSLRVNPNNGALAEEDTRLNPAGQEIVAIAYDQNVVASEPGGTTTLFGISRLGAFVRIGGVDGTPSPNDGETTPIGLLGAIPDDDGVGFDISAQGSAFATMRVGGVTGLYEIDTSTGLASFVGEVGDGDLDLQSIAVRIDGAAGGVPQGATQYTSLETPTRLVDTRSTAKVAADGSIDVPVAGQAGVPDGATSAVLNVTVTQADEAGFTTVYPAGTDRPTTSSLNIENAEQTRAALVTTPIGADGQVTVYSDPGSHIVVDVFGYYAPLATGAGSLTSVAPERLLDTRSGLGVGGGSTDIVTGGSSLAVDVLDRAGVPAEGVGAVVVNLTATQAGGPGFVTAWGNGDELPLASNLNVSATGETIANLAIVPVSDEGTIRLYTDSDTHLLVDVMGYFGGDPNALATPSGSFLPIQPERVLDTRHGAGPVAPDTTVNVTVADAAWVPAEGVMGIAGTVTLTQSTEGGYVTAFPAGGLPPEASNLNVTDADATIANGIVVGLGNGQLSLYTDRGGHLLTDVVGYYLD